MGCAVLGGALRVVVCWVVVCWVRGVCAGEAKRGEGRGEGKMLGGRREGTMWT